MSRSILFVLVYLCHSLFSTPSIAQSVGGTAATGSDQNNTNQKPQYQTGRPVRGAVDARVSVARLSVPRKARQLYEKALEAWQQQKPAEAQRKIDQALKIEPAFPEALTLNGFMQASHRQWASAEQSLQASIRSDPNYCPAYIILAGVYNTQERYDEAQDAAQRATSAGVDTWSVQYEIARVLIGKREYENALAIADAALRSKHGSLLHVAKAHALLGLRRYSEAAAELRNFFVMSPEEKELRTRTTSSTGFRASHYDKRANLLHRF